MNQDPLADDGGPKTFPRDRLERFLLAWTVRIGLFVLTPAYGFAMLAWPFLAGHGRWAYVHQVWYDWQSLNVGMLALVSSAIVFKASKYQADQQRRRDFRAAQAFLPAALDDLTQYLHASASILKTAWEQKEQADAAGDDPDLPLADVGLDLPPSYRSVFADCIRHAEPEVGDFLAKVLAELQVHQARLSDLSHGPHNGIVMLHGYDTLMSYIFRVGTLQARVNRLFPLARNEEPLNLGSLDWPELKTAYANVKLILDHFEHPPYGTLEAFSKRWVKRHEGQPF